MKKINLLLWFDIFLIRKHKFTLRITSEISILRNNNLSIIPKDECVQISDLDIIFFIF